MAYETSPATGERFQTFPGHTEEEVQNTNVSEPPGAALCYR